jgi:hypothetical protein
MSSRDLLLAVIVAVMASCLAGVLWLRESLRTGGRPLPAAMHAAVAEEVPGLRIETDGFLERGRAPLDPGTTIESIPGTGSTPGELEHAAELALADECSDAERIEALRAVWKACTPRAAELLATAVETLPDASRPESVSVPRFALACLAQSAAGDADARQALAHVAWDRETRTAAELRRIAAAGLAAIADETQGWLILFQLGLEQDALLLENTAAALARNPRAGAAAEAAAALVPAPCQEVEIVE